MSSKIKILGLCVGDQLSDTTRLQRELTKYGNVIRTRLGLNQDDSVKGIILLELYGDEQEMANLEKALSKIEGLQLQSMQF
jgi:hypothetical protein